MLQDHFYHYTSFESARDIFENEASGGLRPRRRFIFLGHGNDLPEKAHEGAVFGMLKERPAEFVNEYWRDGSLSNVFNDVLEKARSHFRPTFLLKADVIPEDDVFVADWGVHFDPAFKGTHDSPKVITDRVKDAYWQSLVPLQDYEDGSYRIPEVICFNTIPTERLAIAKVIPGTEMPRYVETGMFDATALEADKAERDRISRRGKDLLKTRLAL